jgi:hypothetical protein
MISNVSAVTWAGLSLSRRRELVLRVRAVLVRQDRLCFEPPKNDVIRRNIFDFMFEACTLVFRAQVSFSCQIGLAG